MKTEIIPVIHVEDLQQTYHNINICKELGIKKVFLITHSIDMYDLLDIAYTIKVSHPDLWVGINLLGIPTGQMLANQVTGVDLNDFDGIWCDGTIAPELALKVRQFKNMFFGGLAFKYQPQPKDLYEACQEAIMATDVAVTSGPGTGKEADDEKIKNIREYLEDHPMAIASGVSAQNIHKYSGIVNYLLVASSITEPYTELIIKDKLLELIELNLLHNDK